MTLSADSVPEHKATELLRGVGGWGHGGEGGVGGGGAQPHEVKLR